MKEVIAMIHPIYGETDYRKIDRNKLNPHIPKGRGMVKWAPFATMPQQFADINRQIKQQTAIERPTLSNDRLEELNYTLKEALHNRGPLYIEYFNDGALFDVIMTVEKVDRWALIVIGTEYDTGQMSFISLIDIVRLTLL